MGLAGTCCCSRGAHSSEGHKPPCHREKGKVRRAPSCPLHAAPRLGPGASPAAPNHPGACLQGLAGLPQGLCSCYGPSWGASRASPPAPRPAPFLGTLPRGMAVLETVILSSPCLPLHPSAPHKSGTQAGLAGSTLWGQRPCTSTPWCPVPWETTAEWPEQAPCMCSGVRVTCRASAG